MLLKMSNVKRNYRELLIIKKKEKVIDVTMNYRNLLLTIHI